MENFPLKTSGGGVAVKLGLYSKGIMIETTLSMCGLQEEDKIFLSKIGFSTISDLL